MIDAYKKFWKGYVNFSDRSTRADYWWVQLWHFLILFLPLTVVVSSVLKNFIKAIRYANFSADQYYFEFSPFSDASGVTWFMLAFLIMYSLAVFRPDIAVTVRRIRDAGFHSALIYLFFIPGLIFVLSILPSKNTERNKNAKVF